MGNRQGKPPAEASESISVTISRRSTSSSVRGLGRISNGLSRLSARVGLRRRSVAGRARVANSRHQLEKRLAEVIKAKAAAAEPTTPRCKFNRLLLRFGTLHEGFNACRAAFRQLAGSEDGELSFEQLKTACTSLGYKLDEETLQRVFVSADREGRGSLNAEEFVATLAILHVLKGPEDEQQVDPAILATWRTAEAAFMSFASARDGYIQKEELMEMMHEGPTDLVRHSAGGSGLDPIRGIAQRRFAELDKSGSGRVSFLEFLFCLESWVEETEEEEGEEEEEKGEKE